MKKIISLVLCVLFVCMSSGLAYASSAQTHEKAYGRLYDENGMLVAVIDGEKTVEKSRVYARDGSRDVKETYSFDINSSVLLHSHDVSGMDSYMSILATLTVNYTEFVLSPNAYLLTNVSGSWTMPDESNLSLNGGRLAFQCTGLGPDAVFADQHSQYTLLTEYTGFSQNTGYTQRIVADGISVMGASMEIYIVMTNTMGHSRTWTLELVNYPNLSVTI